MLATRCDGVVEFSYEKRGHIVCDGTNSARANISRPRVGVLENHNDVHLGSLEAGEICPRVQAADQGDTDHALSGSVPMNSHMITTEGPSIPTIAEFYVTPWFIVLPPRIGFRVEAPRYDHVFVQMLVSRDGGPFRFVHTEALETEESPEATWAFERVRAGSWEGAHGADLATTPWLLLTLADADLAPRWPHSRIITPAGPRDRGVCRAIISGDVSAPEEVRIPFLVGHPARADS